MAKIHLTKKMVDKMMKTKEKTRGVVLKTLGDYIFERKGKEGVKSVQKRMEELGYPVDFDKTFSFKWYPGPLGGLALLATLEVFDWDESMAFDVGYNSPIQSSVTKLIVQRFTSLKQALQVMEKYWHKFSSVGEIKVTDYDAEKRYVVIRLDGFIRVHIVGYEYMRGFFAKIFTLFAKNKKVKANLTKCTLKGDSYDEFKITW